MKKTSSRHKQAVWVIEKSLLTSGLLVLSLFLAVLIQQTPQDIRQQAQTTPTSPPPPQCAAASGTCKATTDGCFGEETDVGQKDCTTGQTCCSFTIPPQCLAKSGVCVIDNASCFDTEVDLGQTDCPTGRRCCAQKVDLTPTVATAIPTPTTGPTTTPSPTQTTNPTATVPPTAKPVQTAQPTFFLSFPTPTSGPTLQLPTLIPGNTGLIFSALIHGIGNSGDSVASPSSLSNKIPQHKTRDFSIMIGTDSKTVSLQYDAGSGSFRGALDLGNNWTTGLYSLEIKTAGTLVASISSQAIPASVQTELASISLVTGDSNSDGLINALDYNMLIACYHQPFPTDGCTQKQKQASDLNDDGAVDGIDYNLFLREVVGMK